MNQFNEFWNWPWFSFWFKRLLKYELECEMFLFLKQWMYKDRDTTQLKNKQKCIN